MANTVLFPGWGRADDEYDSSVLVANQIRPTSPGIAVNDAARIPCFRMDRSKLSSAASRPTVFPQEISKVSPHFPFAPGVPQGPAPAASGLEVCRRGGVYDGPDWVGAVLLAKSEQFANTPSPRFCSITSPQLNIELKHDSEIVVEREPAS
jgi:hypothetical protein